MYIPLKQLTASNPAGYRGETSSVRSSVFHGFFKQNLAFISLSNITPVEPVFFLTENKWPSIGQILPNQNPLGGSKAAANLHRP